MAEIRGDADSVVGQVAQALQAYEAAHPKASIVIYRQNSVSVRVRIIDPELAGLSKGARHDLVWRYFDSLPDEVQSEISILLLLAPTETATSFANMDFEHPIPSNF